MIEYSNLGKYAIDLNDGEGWRVLPIQPNDQKVLEASDPLLRLNGTKVTPMYWDVLLTFQTLHKGKFEKLAQMWNPGRQKIKLNMMSTINPLQPATGTIGSGWYSVDAIWRLPPIATLGSIRGVIVYDFTLTLHQVELDLLNNVIAI